MRNYIFGIIAICLVCIGCGKPEPTIEPISQSVSATILLPSKKPLSNQKIILMPVEIYGPIRAIVTNTNSDGVFTIPESEQTVYPISYKIYVILKSPKHKTLLPSKYYDREDDESDLIVDMANIVGNLTLKMKK